ncbi:hypothetical protein ACOME3_005910 [Neoechinorhynchus agilis]
MASLFSNDDVMLISSGFDNSLRIWDMKSMTSEQTLMIPPGSFINCLTIHPNKSIFAAGCSNAVLLFDLNISASAPLISYEALKSKSIFPLFCKDLFLNLSAFCANPGLDGNWLYGGGEDNFAKVWRITYARMDDDDDEELELAIDRSSESSISITDLQLTNKLDIRCTVNTMVLHPNQVEMFIGDRRGVITQWNLANDQVLFEIPSGSLDIFSAIRHIDINAEATMCVASNSSGMCFYYQMVQQRNQDGSTTQATSLNLRRKLQIHDTYALCCRFSPDSTMFATTSADETATVWRTADFEMIVVLKDKEQSWVWDCAFTLDSEYLLTASSDEQIRVWHIATATIKRVLCGHSLGVNCFAFRDLNIAQE